VRRVVAFYMSVLEHEWVIILEAENAHDIEELSIAVGISSYNTVKIVPLRYFDDVIKKLEVNLESNIHVTNEPPQNPFYLIE